MLINIIPHLVTKNPSKTINLKVDQNILDELIYNDPNEFYLKLPFH